MCNETFYTCTIVHICKCFFGVKPRSKNLGSELIYLLHFDKYFQTDLAKAVPKYPPKPRSIPISFNIDQPWVLAFFPIFANLEKNYIHCHLSTHACCQFPYWFFSLFIWMLYMLRIVTLLCTNLRYFCYIINPFLFWHREMCVRFCLSWWFYLLGCLFTPSSFGIML